MLQPLCQWCVHHCKQKKKKIVCLLKYPLSWICHFIVDVKGPFPLAHAGRKPNLDPGFLVMQRQQEMDAIYTHSILIQAKGFVVSFLLRVIRHGYLP